MIRDNFSPGDFIVKLPSHAILLSYMNAVQRIEDMIDAAENNEHATAWLRAMIAINEVYDRMMDIPYGVIDSKMHCLGAGRQVWRLFHAVQLLAEWRFTQGTDVTEEDVVIAFSKVGDEERSGDTIFPCDNVSPAAQRAILATPFFADGMRGWIVEGVGTESPTMVTITGGMGVTAEHIPPNVRFDPARKIWDVVHD